MFRLTFNIFSAMVFINAGVIIFLDGKILAGIFILLAGYIAIYSVLTKFPK